MRIIEYSLTASQDLADAHDYIARNNATAARAFVESVRAAVDMLAEFPGAGHRRDDVSDERYRFWRVKSHLIVYRFDISTLTVVGVIHGARDFRSVL